MKLAFSSLLTSLVITWLVAGVLAPQQYNPYLVLSLSGETNVHILQNKIADEANCRKINQAIGSALVFGCPTCQIKQSECIKNFDDTKRRWLDGTFVDHPSIPFHGGIIVFEGKNPSLAKSACEAMESQTSNLRHEDRLTCIPSGENPPAIASPLESNSPTAYLFIGIAVTFLSLVLVLYSQKGKSVSSAHIEKIAFLMADALVLGSAFLAVNIHGTIDTRGLVTHLILSLVTLAWFWVINEHYARRRPFWDELREIFRTLGIALLLASTAILQTEYDLLPTLILWFSTFVLIPLGRASLRGLMNQMGIWEKPAIIVGTGNNAREAFEAIRQEKNLGYRINAFAAPAWQHDVPDTLQIGEKKFPVVQLNEAPEQQLISLGQPQIIIGLDSLAPLENQRLIKTLSRFQHNIHIIPTLRGLPLFGTQLSHFFSHEVLFMTVRNNLARRSYRWIKRSFDLFVSLCLIALLSPLLIALTVLIRRSGGTAFYGHQRIGQDGKLFKCLKFRSMRPDADRVLKELLANDPVAKAEWDKDFKLKNDPRITTVGHFIRKTSLDELPQLFNVLKGEMSLVGPRPVVKDELERYGSASVFYLEAKPGITGLWQISGRNDTTYAERVSLDSWYVQNWSLWYDIAILFKTIDVVFNRRGAY